MTEAQVLQLINQFIIANGNNEITANVLRPILVEMLQQPNDKIGDLVDLDTQDKSTIVAAINETLDTKEEYFKIHAGPDDPNVNPPASFSIGDWYIRSGQFLYQYNGDTWNPNTTIFSGDGDAVLIDDGSSRELQYFEGIQEWESGEIENRGLNDVYRIYEGDIYRLGNVTFPYANSAFVLEDWVLVLESGIPVSEKGVAGGVATLDGDGDLVQDGKLTPNGGNTTDTAQSLREGIEERVKDIEVDGEILEKDENGKVVVPVIAGRDGADGADGLSAYEIWLAEGNTGSEQEFLDSLEGPEGPQGPDGEKGNKGDPFTVDAQGTLADRDTYDSEATGFSFFATDTSLLYFKTDTGWTDGTPFGKGDAGEDGKEIELQKTLTHIQWRYVGGVWQDLIALSEIKGEKGDAGTDGTDGADGDSAYQVWLDNGNIGTEQDFLNSLRGADGQDGTDGTNGVDGESAYEIWLSQGNTGTEQDFINSLKGQDGQDGQDGSDANVTSENIETALGFTPADSSTVDKTIGTLIELRQYEGTTGEAVNVLGRGKKGDGLIAPFPFIWDDDSEEADNNATIIAVDGVSVGRWKVEIQGAVNVAWFGAKADYNRETEIGTDNAVEFYNAFEFAKSLKITLYINGHYKIIRNNVPEIMRISTGVNLLGEGIEHSSVIAEQDSSISNVFEFELEEVKSASIKGISFQNCNEFRGYAISDCEFIDNEFIKTPLVLDAKTDETGIGSNVRNKILRNRFIGYDYTTNPAYDPQASYTDAELKDLGALSFGLRLASAPFELDPNTQVNPTFGNYDNLIEGNYFELWAYAAIELAGPNNLRNTIRKNSFEWNKGTCVEMDKGASFNIVDDNRFYETRETDFFGGVEQGDVQEQKSGGNLPHNNTFINNKHYNSVSYPCFRSFGGYNTNFNLNVYEDNSPTSGKIILSDNNNNLDNLRNLNNIRIEKNKISHVEIGVQAGDSIGHYESLYINDNEFLVSGIISAIPNITSGGSTLDILEIKNNVFNGAVGINIQLNPKLLIFSGNEINNDVQNNIGKYDLYDGYTYLSHYIFKNNYFNGEGTNIIQNTNESIVEYDGGSFSGQTSNSILQFWRFSYLSVKNVEFKESTSPIIINLFNSSEDSLAFVTENIQQSTSSATNQVRSGSTALGDVQNFMNSWNSDFRNKKLNETTLKETARTFSSIQTFDVSPIVPTPTQSNQAANKTFVDDVRTWVRSFGYADGLASNAAISDDIFSFTANDNVRVSNITSNLPVSENGYAKRIYRSSSFAQVLYTTDSNKYFVATKAGGAWSDWKELAYGEIKPPVDETYADVAALLADQNNQEKDYFYEVTDASGLTAISSGAAVLLYNASTPTGTENDYIIIWSENPIGIVEQPLTDSATVNWNVSENQLARLLATSAVGNTRTLTISNSNPGVNYQLTYIQDATGGRDLDLSGFDKVYGSIDLTANAESIITVCVTNAGTSFVVITSDVSSGIDNITEIPNRSYNDLQDLPTKPFKEVTTQQYTLIEEDKNKFLVFTYAGTVDLDVPQSVFVDTDTIIGFRDVLNEDYRINVNGFDQNASLAFVQSARGKTNIVNNLGSFDIRFYASNASVLNGNLVEEYTTRQSPDGTIWKIAVDNTGTEVITAL